MWTGTSKSEGERDIMTPLMLRSLFVVAVAFVFIDAVEDSATNNATRFVMMMVNIVSEPVWYSRKVL